MYPEPPTPTKVGNPTICPSCYSLDLYCDHWFNGHDFKEFPHCYMGETYGQCATKARKSGWLLHRNGTATCPKCCKALSIGKYSKGKK